MALARSSQAALAAVPWRLLESFIYQKDATQGPAFEKRHWQDLSRASVSSNSKQMQGPSGFYVEKNSPYCSSLPQLQRPQTILCNQQTRYLRLPDSIRQLSTGATATPAQQAAVLVSRCESLRDVEEVGARQSSEELQQAAAAAAHMLPELPVHAVAQLAWAFGTMQVTCPELVSALPAALYSRLGEMTGSSLARALWGCAALGTQHSELFAAATDFLLDVLQDLGAEELSLVASAYALADHYEDDADFFDALAAAAEARLALFGPQQLADTLAAFAALRHRSTTLLDAAAGAAAALQDELTMQQAGKLAWALARLGSRPLDLLPDLADSVALRLGAGGGLPAAADVAPHYADLARLAHALALTGQHSSALAATLRRVLRRVPFDVAGEEHRAMLFHAQLVSWEMGVPGPLLGVQVPSYFTSWALRESALSVHEDRGGERSWQLRDPQLLSRPAMLATLRSAVRQYGLAIPGRPQPTLDGLFQVDIPILVEGERVALEPAMPWECCRNAPHEPLAETHARWRSLRHRRWRIAELPWSLWKAAEGPEARAELLRQTLQSAR